MKNLVYFVPAALYYTLIFIFSSRPHPIEIGVPLFDKWIHLVEFGLLGLLISFGYFKSLKSSLRIKGTLTFSSGALLGILDEVHQYFVPGRRSDILDATVDTLGIALGIFLYWYLSQKMKLKTLEKL